jgi:hypothetical protein
VGGFSLYSHVLSEVAQIADHVVISCGPCAWPAFAGLAGTGDWRPNAAGW